MTTKSAYPQFVGKTGVFNNNGLDTPVNILNHRFVFGRDDLEIQAIGGKRTKWVSAEAVTLTSN